MAEGDQLGEFEPPYNRNSLAEEFLPLFDQILSSVTRVERNQQIECINISPELLKDDPESAAQKEQKFDTHYFHEFVGAVPVKPSVFFQKLYQKVGMQLDKDGRSTEWKNLKTHGLQNFAHAEYAFCLSSELNQTDIATRLLGYIKHAEADGANLYGARGQEQLVKELKQKAKDALQIKGGSRRLDKNYLEALSQSVIQEIERSIGAKYIPELFVSRSLSDDFPKSIESVITSHEAIHKINNLIEELECFLKKTAWLEKQLINSNHTILSGSSNHSWSPRKQISTLYSFKENYSGNNTYYYPAKSVVSNLEEIVRTVSRLRESLILITASDKKKFEDKGVLSSLFSDIKENAESYLSHIKPTTVLVDRAGGGKTNLLCDFAINISKKYPTFFIAAKSIIEATSDSITDYISSSYNVSETPIDDALKIAAANGTYVIFVIDGINEHYSPSSFNRAIQKFINNTHDKPVRFFISCRDIYWQFFNDDWWSKNTRTIFHDELNSFTKWEFKYALPKYLSAFHISARLSGEAKEQLSHPLLLRFFCEAYRGIDSRPSKLGSFQDVRLVPLFSTYCQRKYENIRKRLNLASSGDVSDFVNLIAILMLNQRKRDIPVGLLKEQAMHRLGESNFYSKKSKYLQILDEDIIIEQKPVGSLKQLKVEFVYDEFMEYIIAIALFFDSRFPDELSPLEKASTLLNELKVHIQDFVSISGVLGFIGEFIAKLSKDQAAEYVVLLIKNDQQHIACQILSRWPDKKIPTAMAEHIILLHSQLVDIDLRRKAWKALEKLDYDSWERVFFYITSEMEYEGYFRLSRVFGFLNRFNGGKESDDRIKSLLWISKMLNSFKDPEGGDFKVGLAAFNSIYLKAIKVEKNKEKLFDLEQIKQANQKLIS